MDRYDNRIKTRAGNLSKFSREFEVGDIVKSNKLDKSGLEFGIVVSKVGSKIMNCKNILNGRTFKAHACDLEKIGLSESQLKLMLL